MMTCKPIAPALILAFLSTGVGQDQPATKPIEDHSAVWWSNWRGPDCRAIAPTGDPPVEWSEDRNILWKTALPGTGSSSPIVWQDRIYVTTGIETDQPGEPPVRPAAGEPRFAGPTPKTMHRFELLALHRATGKVQWQKTVVAAVPHEGLHSTMTQVGGSPLTDGEHLFVYFGSRGLYCLDLTGAIVWSKQLGIMRTRREWGEGASPALHGDTLVVNWDHEGEDFVVAIDKRTGEERWRKKRDEPTSWSTPLVVAVDGRPQVIIAATNASRSYDLETGDVLWSCRGMTVNCIPTPVHADGVVYLMSGYRGQMLQAVRLRAAKGDVTDTKSLLWSHRDSTSYVPSALLYGGRLFFLRQNSAVLSCLDAATGKVHFAGQRMRGLGTVYASPVGVAGRIYITGRNGTTKVIAAGDRYRELSSNKLDDTFDGSAALVGDRIYLRGRKSLYAIGVK